MFNLKLKLSKRFDYEAIFKKLVFELQSLERASENIFEILKTILDMVGAKSGSLFLYQESTQLFVLKKWIAEQPLNVSVAKDYEFLSFLKQVQNPIIKEEVLKHSRFVDIRSAAIHYFTQLSCVAVMPLVAQNKWVGILNVGRSVTKKAFDEEDRTLIFLLSSWLTHQITNNLLFNEVCQKNKILAEVAELKNQLLANVTHELRTPLNGIMGMTEIILDGSDGQINEDQKRHLEMIKTASDSLLEIVDNMLSLMKVESSKSEVEIKKLDLVRLIEEVSQVFETVIVSHDNRFQTHVDRQLTVYGDENQIRTVLLNLLGNAFKFTKNGQVEIFAEQSGEMIKICVKDTGIGISEEDQEKIFESFRQANGAYTREYGGLGMGLTIAKRIVELHGGRIWVDSVPGKGSEFYFTLPTKPVRIQYTEAH